MTPSLTVAEPAGICQSCGGQKYFGLAHLCTTSLPPRIDASVAFPLPPPVVNGTLITIPLGTRR